jgi:two-component system phosphate regulon response regulator PhoB
MPTGKLILIIEDSPEVAGLLRDKLEAEGYYCDYAADGEEGLVAARRQPPDLILLDRGLPRLTGDDVAQRLKSDPRSRNIPIIMLTGKADESDQLVGFALGADDYVAKPFSSKVLLARIAAQLRKKEIEAEEHDQLPAFCVELDRTQPRVLVDKNAIPLTATEYRILAALMAAGGTVLHSTQLLPMVYGKDNPQDERRLAGHVGGLRRKMGPAAGCIQVIADGEYAFCSPHGPRPSA